MQAELTYILALILNVSLIITVFLTKMYPSGETLQRFDIIIFVWFILRDIIFYI